MAQLLQLAQRTRPELLEFQAPELWPEITSRGMESVECATEVANFLFTNGSTEKTRNVFRTLCRHHLDKGLDEFWVGHNVLWDAPAVAAKQAKIMLEKHQDPIFGVHLVKALQLQFEYKAALALTERLAPLVSDPQIATLLRQMDKESLCRQQISDQWLAERKAPGMKADYRIAVINLEKDAVRMMRMAGQLARHNMRFNRIEAVHGATLPDLVSLGLTHGASKKMKGTLGCFLSHVRAWEICVAQEEEHMFVLEDDTWFLLPPPPSVKSLGLPDFDLCFVNQRMESPALATDMPPSAHRIEEIAAARPEIWQSAGTDGYFVSRAGARKLLEMVKLDGMFGDIDWRLVLYAMGDDWQTHVSPASFAMNVLRSHAEHRHSTERLDAYALAPAIIGHLKSPSRRQQMNELTHAHLEDIEA